MKWKIFKEGDEEYLSVVYRSYGKSYGGYYITSSLEPGDYYIPVYELGDPREPDNQEETVSAEEQAYRDELLMQPEAVHDENIVNDRTDTLDEIEVHEYSTGCCAYFYIHGQQYCADLTYIPTYAAGRHSTECMVFRAKDDQVDDWCDLYCKRDVSVSREGLLGCIEEFMASNI